MVTTETKGRREPTQHGILPCPAGGEGWRSDDLYFDGRSNRVGRVLSFYSNRRNWASPNPSPGSGGRGTLAGERGVGRVPIPTRGQTVRTLWYSLYIRTLWAVRTACHDVYRMPWHGAAQLWVSGNPSCVCCWWWWYITKNIHKNTVITNIMQGREAGAASPCTV